MKYNNSATSSVSVSYLTLRISGLLPLLQMAAIQLFKTSRLSPNPLFHLSSFSSSFSSSPSDQTNTSIPSVASILTNLKSKSRWGYLRTLYPSGFTPSEFSQIALQIKNNPHLVLRFFRWTQNPTKSLCRHDLLSYSTTIHILARSRLKPQAYSLLRDLLRLSEPLDVFEHLVKSYRRCDSAPFVFDYLIRACLESRKTDAAVHISRMLLSRGGGGGIGLRTLNGLIRCVMRCRGAYAGYEMFKEVFAVEARAKSGPDVETFNEMMSGFYRDGAVEMVKEVWDQMAEFGCCPDCCSYCILMESYCEDEAMSKAEEVWEEMRRNNVEADAVAYSIMIGGFCRVGEIEMAEEFFKEMGLSGIESSGATFEHLVRGYCKIGRIDSAMLVYKDMVRRDFRAESLTVDELIRGLCDESRVFEALEVMRGAMGEYGFCPSEKSYEFMIRGFCAEGKMEEALKLQAHMVGKGFKPNCEIYSAFIGGYMKEGNTEVAELLRNEMLDTQVCGIAD